MGYQTTFDGEFEISPPLKPEHEAYLNAFARTRHMQRDEKQLGAAFDLRRIAGTSTKQDKILFAAQLPPTAAFTVSTSVTNDGEFVTDHNNPPEGQPGLWCQWVPTSDTTLAWDEGEKFYSYREWLEYLIATFFEPWGYTLNGTVIWEGEDSDDRGKLVVENNTLRVQRAVVHYVDEET